MNLLVYKLFADKGRTYINTVTEYQQALHWLSLDPMNTFVKDFVEYKEDMKEKEYNKKRANKIKEKYNKTNK